MTKLFWTSLSLFAASAVAVPMAVDGARYTNTTTTENVQAPSQVIDQQDNGRCNVVQTIYITETATPTPSPPVVTVEIAIATPVSSSQQSCQSSHTAGSEPQGAAVKEPEAPQAPPAPVSAPAPAEAEPKAPEAPAPAPEAPAKAPEAPVPAEPATTTEAAPAASDEAPVSPPAGNSGSSNSGSGSGLGAINVMHTGQATYYSPNANLPVLKDSPVYGACGFVNTDADKVVALQHSLYTGLKSANQNKCGSKIRISYNGKTAEATVADMCPGCKTEYDLDLSESLFEELEPNLGVGVLKGIEWEFI